MIYNVLQIYEVIDRVSDLQKNWPEEFGDINDGGIGVVCHYADQVNYHTYYVAKEKKKTTVYRQWQWQFKQHALVEITFYLSWQNIV